MRMSVRSSWSAGYTLIEVLAVVVLMGLLAAAFVPSLAQTSDSAERERVHAELIGLDARARQHAQTGRRCELRWDGTSRSMRLIEGAEQSVVLKAVSVPEWIELDVEGGATSVEMNALGQSVHYAYMLRADSWSTRLSFNGLSGWYEVRSDAK